jgi:hypothetical protein|tara:strand:+ start:979 stop:1269 length:291 start_codon:yes stop_codon:yes gene_type:complete
MTFFVLIERWLRATLPAREMAKKDTRISRESLSSGSQPLMLARTSLPLSADCQIEKIQTPNRSSRWGLVFDYFNVYICCFRHKFHLFCIILPITPA